MRNRFFLKNILQLPECRLQPAVIQAMAGINNSSGASKMTLSVPITKKVGLD